MALILSIETGTEVCSVALARDGEVVALREDSSRDHARLVARYVDEVLAEAGTLDAVAVGRGPGSYTGLRIGTSLAKGVCYGLNVPLIAINPLAELAELVRREEFPADALLCSMLDARRMEVYAQLFDVSGRELTPITAEIVDENSFREWRDRGAFVIFGPGARKCREVLSDARYLDVTPSARGMVRLAHEAFVRRDFQDVAYYEPEYLKEWGYSTTSV